MSRSDMVCATLAEVALQADPVNPDWILEGRPTARSATLSRSADDASGSALWECTAGTFRWYFGVDETVHILDGEVVVRDRSGSERTLRPGDVALFRAGSWATWRVPRYVRKLAFYHQQVPAPVARGLALARRLRALLRVLPSPRAAAAVTMGRRRLSAGANMSAVLAVVGLV